MNIYRKSDIPTHLQQWFEPAEIGLEPTPEEYVKTMVSVFREVRRVLKDDGTLWLNLGDSYASGGNNRSGEGEARTRSTLRGDNPVEHGHTAFKQRRTTGETPGLKPKNLVGIPWRVAFALQADGWYLRQDIIWHKPNPMPESVTDRCTKAHEYIFLLSKSARYYYNAKAIKEPAMYAGSNGNFSGGKKIGRNDNPSGNERRDSPSYEVKESRNKRSVWTVPTHPYKGAHFAVFPPDLIRPCVLAGCPEGGTILEPFLGAGTTAVVAKQEQCKCIGIELNEEYAAIAATRLRQQVLAF